MVKTLQATMGFVVLCGAAIMGLHAYIVHKFPQQRVPSAIVAKAQRLAQRKREQERLQQQHSLAAADVAPSSAGEHVTSSTPWLDASTGNMVCLLHALQAAQKR